MAVLIDILTVAVTIVGVAFGAVMLDSIREQAKASTPWLVDWLCRQAVKRLPEQMRDEVGEEWAAWLNETPGPLAKLWCAFGFLISVFRVPKSAPLTQKDNKSATTTTTRAISLTYPSYADLISVYTQYLLTLDEHQLTDQVRNDTDFIDQLISITYEYDWHDNRERLRYLMSILKTYRDEIVHDCPACRRRR